MVSIASSSILRNAWLDRFLNEDREDLKQQIKTIYGRLSYETRVMVAKKICQHEAQSDDDANSGYSFLQKHPLHPSVRLAFRSIFDELTHEVREYPEMKWIKLLLGIENMMEVMQVYFRILNKRQAIPPSQLRFA